MPSQSELKRQLTDASNPIEKRDAALALFAATESRQNVEIALQALRQESVTEILDDSHRGVLRDKFLHYHHAPPAKDKAASIRETLTRLLVHIGHPEDEDIYRIGVATYYMQPVDDVAQNLRAVALAGLAGCNRDLACLCATKLLGEVHTSVFNNEPSITAIRVLANSAQYLPIYSFILRIGMAFAGRHGEAVARAFEALPDDFPVNLFREAALTYIEANATVVCSGIIDAIIERGEAELYDLIETIINTTNDSDLHRYALIVSATSRKDELVEMVYRLARLSMRDQLHHFIEAIELTIHAERDETLSMLRKRL